MIVELNSQRYLCVSKGRMELCRLLDLHSILTVFRLSLHTYEVPRLNSHHEKTRRDFTRRLALLNPTSSYRDYNESSAEYLGSKFFSQ